MNILKSLEALKEYVNENISNSNEPTRKLDNGIRAMALKVQEDYKFDFGLPNYNYVVRDLKDVVKLSYPNEEEWIESFAERDYVSNVILGKSVDIEKIVREIKAYDNKIDENGGLNFKDGYELTHLIWALNQVCQDNNIVKNYKELMSDSLLNLHSTLPNSDLKTECIYFLTLIDLSKVEEEYIREIEESQLPDGTFKGTMMMDPDTEREDYFLIYHHLCLALLSLYNYNNTIITH